MEPDFSGYATKAGLLCTDGRTIMPNAFKHQDKMKVPLVWQHGHRDPENVLGHAILENRDDGVYTYGYFNDSPKAQHAKGLLEHGDINALSIWANELVERSKRVLHGAIREVSLVLSGANPGALIENVTIRHSDGDEDLLEDEAIITTGLEIELMHSDAGTSGNSDNTNNGNNADQGPTVQEVYDSMSEEQQNVLHYMIGAALEEAGATMKQSGLEETDTNNEEGTMSRNVFESGDSGNGGNTATLSHADIKGIVADATKCGSLKEAVENYALEHGITDIGALFPEATQLTNAPEWITRDLGWVDAFLNGARKTPFSRIKTATADLTYDDARAKGYIKGNLKKEQFFSTLRRVTTPQTVYKKQKLDRDDIIDITDFDVVAWIKTEMQFMLKEEVARACLIGDGRDIEDEDKISEENIRPIAKDDDFYTVRINVNLGDPDSSVQEVIDSIIRSRKFYKGTGNPTMYTTEEFLLLRDTLGRRIYKSLDELAAELRVSAIIPVEVLEDEPDIVAVLVNMSDYAIGADKGGQTTMFDDFDIDYNQYKYLIETRMSAALTKPRSAMVVMKTGSEDVLLPAPGTPSYDPETGVVTLPTSTHYTWFLGDPSNEIDLSDGAQTALAIGETQTYTAVADNGYYFATSENDEWTFTRS